MSFQAIAPRDITSSTQSFQHALDAIRSKSADKPTHALCLFVGRSDELPLPEEEGTLWVSLDIRPSKLPSDKQIHLQMDFNNPAQMKLISGLFDKVVLDQSTLKFIDSDEPWVFLGKLLKPQPSSLLISEAHGGIIQLLPREEAESHSNIKSGTFCIPEEEEFEAMNQKNAFFKHYKHTIGKEQYEKELQAFKNSLDKVDIKSFQILGFEREVKIAFKHFIIEKQGQFATSVAKKYKLLSEEQTLPYLQTLFNSVTLVRDKPYPYETHYEPCHYYILQGPKPTVVEHA